jgi:AcrR family transcriptional regulator
MTGTPGTPATEAQRLPRGRHTLSRDDVVEQQRARILTAFGEVLTERGYVNTPVAAVLERAGVSRETFYQQFASKPDCFVAALDDTVAELAATMTAGLPAAEGSTPVERFDRMLALYLGALAAQPARARLFLIETYAAGPEAMRRRLELQGRFIESLAAVFGVRSAVGRLACEALIGAVISMVTARFVTGDIDGLDAIRAPIVELAASALT